MTPARTLAPPTSPVIIARQQRWRAILRVIDRGHDLGVLLSHDDAAALVAAVYEVLEDRRPPCASS